MSGKTAEMPLAEHRGLIVDGVIAGCHEVLRRQGLLAGRWCLDPDEDLSPGQAEAIDRAYRSYPELSDDEFVAANLERWLEAP